MAKFAAKMVHRLPITKARINLGAVAKRAHLAGEYFILEKDGIPIAGIMGADEMEDYLEARDPKVRQHIRRSHEDLLPELSRATRKRSSRRGRPV